MMHECSTRCPVCSRARARRHALIAALVEPLAWGVEWVWTTILQEIALSPETRAGIWAEVLEAEGGGEGWEVS